MKLALLTNLIPPYRVRFFRELSTRCELTVVCDTLKCPLRQWEQDPSTFGFDFIELGRAGQRFVHKRPDAGYREERIRSLGAGVRRQLNALDPNVVVSCEFGMRSVVADRYCRKRGIPLVIWSEGTRLTEKTIRGPRLWLRKRLARHAAGFWTNGLASSRYLQDLGAASGTITEGITGIDTHAFARAAAENAVRRDRLRASHGLEGLTFVFVGALSERKGVIQLMEALEELEGAELPRCSFVFVGDGPLRGELERCRDRIRRFKIVLTGFLDEAGVQELFAASDVFLLPTLDDNWPLVTLEALVSGLPQIGSIYNGASENLRNREGLGWFIDPRKPGELFECIARVIQNPPPRVPEAVQEWAREYYSPEGQAERAEALVRAALNP